MFFSKSLIILILCFMPLLSGAEEEVKTLDQAVFRVSRRAFFLTDVNNYLDRVSALRCLRPSSLILKTLKLDKQTLPQLSKFSNLGAKLSEHSALFDGLISLLKYQMFINEKAVDSLKQRVSRIALGKCFKRLKQTRALKKDVIELLTMELYLQDRFAVESVVFTEKEIAEFAKEHPFWSEKRIENALREQETSKAIKSIRQFTNTLNAKISHDIFY